jgi:F-type H+-transporting ATPase subunit c
METVAAYKLIGAGLAAMGAGFAAIGVGIIFGMFLQGALRNPAAADKLGARLIFGFPAAVSFPPPPPPRSCLLRKPGTSRAAI